MNITSRDVILLAHAAFGTLAGLAALWVFVEALNAHPGNAGRMYKAALIAAISMGATWILGGYWYVHFYPVDKAIILKGPWPFSHNLFMETKEHLIFITGILAFYLPIAVRDKVYAKPIARRMVLSVAMLIVLTDLAAEGAGAIIHQGVSIALQRGNEKGRQ
ncbi:MAG TPA: hypothetical protein VKV15_10375 [Bryobacteraceae bacterium]|nr:hypothetical protein [Bryobacteraceae bacterium]